MDSGDLESPDEVQTRAEKRWQAVIGLFGIFLFLLGSVGWFGSKNRGSDVEVIKVEDGKIGRSVSEDVVVDVSGAVQRPGVYKLGDGARVGEAIEAAGGLSNEADFEWVQQKMNLAQVLTDGIKIYVPIVGDGELEENDAVQGGTLGTVERLVNVNNASVEELDELWGIGESRAKTIVENRPYANLEELMTRAGVPSNVFEKIKSEISLY